MLARLNDKEIEKELLEYDLTPPNPGEECCVVGCGSPVSMICFPYCSHHGQEKAKR